jgi:hypothetical protein
MSDQEGDDDQRRDALLLRLLKTSPQPRPHRERGERKSTREGVSSASAEKPAPSV